MKNKLVRAVWFWMWLLAAASVAAIPILLFCQPITPDATEFEDEGPQIVPGRVEWTKPRDISPTRYEWTMAGLVSTNGTTTSTSAPVGFTLGSNLFAVRGFVGTNPYPAAITNFVLSVTNNATYLGLKWRAMLSNPGPWTAWAPWTNPIGTIIEPTNAAFELSPVLQKNEGFKIESN